MTSADTPLSGTWRPPPLLAHVVALVARLAPAVCRIDVFADGTRTAGYWRTPTGWIASEATTDDGEPTHD